jgi:hypothetical protein
VVKAEHARRSATLCLLACAVAIVVILGTGRAVSVAVAATVTPTIAGAAPNLQSRPPAPPTVTDVTPSKGSTAGGTKVVITGTGFTDADAVTFGGTVATIIGIDSDTQITVTAPAHASGTVHVQVTAASKLVSANTRADVFTYIALPPARATTTVTPIIVTPITKTPTTVTQTTVTQTTVMVTATLVATGTEDDGLSSGWIAFIVAIAVIALIALGAMGYALLKGGRKGGPAA